MKNRMAFLLMAQESEPTLETAPTLAASDSFDRSNGSLGNTDGAGIDGVTGGSGLAWTAQVGTWAIATNTARAASVVSNVAIATVDTGKADGVLVGRANTASATGLVARYVDADNHVRIYIVNTNTLLVVQRVAATPTTLLSKTATYSANAEIVVWLDGNQLSVEYNGTYYGTVTLNAALVSSTLHGMYVNAAGSTLNLSEWHFVNLPTYTGLYQASTVRVMDGNYLITTPVQGDLTRCAEYLLRKNMTVLAGYPFASQVRHIAGSRLVTVATGAKVVLSNYSVNSSGVESAGQIAADGDAEGDYGYFGSIHQSEQSTAFTVNFTPSRWRRYYRRVVIDQTMNTVYPKDKATVIGTTTLQHDFWRNGLTVRRSHTYSAGYRIFGFYGAMLPVYNPTVDYYQVGTQAAAAMALDDGAKNLNTTATIYRAWKNGGDFTVVMELPTGGPDNTGDWSKAGSYKGWFLDNTTSDQKFYANYIDSAYSGRVAAVASSHTARYYVAVGTP